MSATWSKRLFAEPRLVGQERRRAKNARRALLRKELAENRHAAIIGAVIYFGLPFLWTGIYAYVTPHHEVIPGFASGVLLFSGWLFAAVVAAQTVTRDFGRRTGTFLLARPVRPDEILDAKVAASFGLVLALVLGVGALDASLDLDKFLGHESYGRMWLFAGTLTLLGFWLSFVAASLTRQTLTAIMATALGGVLLLVLPLVSNHTALLFNRFAPDKSTILPELVHTSLRSELAPVIVALSFFLLWLVTIALDLLSRWRFTLPGYTRSGFLILLVLALLVVGFPWNAALVALYLLLLMLRAIATAATRARFVLRIGPRAMGITIAVTLVALFLLGMREVGANARVSAVWWDSALGQDAARQYISQLRNHAYLPVIACGSGRVAVAHGAYLRLYDITESSVWETAPPQRHLAWPMPAVDIRATWNVVPFFDPKNTLCAVLSRTLHPGPQVEAEATSQQAEPPTSQAAPREVTHYYEIDWTTWETTRTLELPAPARLLEPDILLHVMYDAAIDDGQLLTLWWYQYRPSDEQVGATGTRPYDEILGARYRLLPDRAELVDTQKLGSGRPTDAFYHLNRGPDGQVRFPLYPYSLRKDVDGFSYAVIPELEPLPPGLESFRHESWVVLFGLRSGEHTGLVSEADGLKSYQYYKLSMKRRDVPISIRMGETTVSPWAQLFRNPRQLLSPGRGLVWEIHQNHAVCYDVSDPRHPRKLVHVHSFPIQNATVGPDFLLLDHGVGFSIVNHPH
jgi:ABC-type transport system involved in multi-copper enzyme maturation permease subunit